MLRRKALKKISKKRKALLPGYNALVTELRVKCKNRSELSGNRADWRSDFQVEPHHICGRTGKLLTDVFNLILVTRAEHDKQDGNTYKEKTELLHLVHQIRIRQGYEQNKYQ